MRPSGHTVLITGGASGIGLALTKKFVQHGNKVIIAGRDEQKLHEASTSLPGVTAIACNIGNADEVDLLVKNMMENHPDLSVLVNNAGIQFNYSFLDGDSERKLGMVQEEININLTAPIHLILKILPLLSSHDQAAVVNVSSGLGLVPKQSAPVYCATKAGLHLFTKALRYQLEATGIKVFELLPPLVDTAMTKGRGRGKLSAEALAEQFWKAYVRDREEVLIGKVKLLQRINRLAPRYAEAIIRNS